MPNNTTTNSFEYYYNKGKHAIEKLIDSSIYFRKKKSSDKNDDDDYSSSSSPSPPSSTTFLVNDRQEKSIEISLRNFYRSLGKISAEGGFYECGNNDKGKNGNNNNNNRKKNNRTTKATSKGVSPVLVESNNNNRNEEYWVIDAANWLKERRCWVPSICLKHLDRTIRDKVHLMIQRDQQDDPDMLYSIGILEECMEILKTLEEPDETTTATSSLRKKDGNGCVNFGEQQQQQQKDKTKSDELVQRGAEVVQELLFSSPYYTPQSKRKIQDRQYDSYKLSGQRLKATLKKYIPPEVYQKGNPDHIHDCIKYLRDHPKVISKLLKKTDILVDVKRTRNDRVFIAIHKFYKLTEEGDCFYQGNDSHLRYIGILDYAHEILSGLKSRTQSIWNIVE